MKRKEFLTSVLGASALLGLPLSSLSYDKKNLQNLVDSTTRKVLGNMFSFSTNQIKKVKIGIIGLGNRGSTLLEMFEYLIKNNHAEIVALCDIEKNKVTKAAEKLSTFQTKTPSKYFKSENEWKKLTKQDNIDLILIATPWHLHAPMSIYGMQHGKHIACEVPIAYTLEDCWNIIQTAEQTNRHCIMIENCCYNEEELWVLNMIEAGVFGDITHAEGAYLHDLRSLLLDKMYYQDQWRLKEHITRNGNFYTTHGLGPISFYLGIGKGDTYSHLTSMSSRELNLSLAAKQAKHPSINYQCGDMNNTLIKTKKGKTILLQFDVHTGRPYSRINKIIGTKAVHSGYPSKLYIDSDIPQSWGHNWLTKELYDEYRNKYQHPIIKKLKVISQNFKQGHGGMDFIMIYRLIRCLNLGLPLDINVYDGVMWSSITPLSEISVASNSNSISIPDFTGGQWKKEKSLEIMREV